MAVGIRQPDRPCLPFLNGVHMASPLKAATSDGAPVVAIVVGPGGMEWYEMGNGDLLTSLWQWRPDLECWDASAVHARPNARSGKE